MIEPAQNMVLGFGRYRVNAIRRQLLCDGKPVQLTAKAFDTLMVLVGRSGQLVTKDELMLAVWPDTVVEENNLIQQISYLRRLLGERAGENSFIVTVPGRGYTFVPAVHHEPVDALPKNASHGSHPTAFRSAFDRGQMIGYFLATAYILLVCLPLFWTGVGRPLDNGHPQSLAVLKFRSGTGGDEFIGTGISDTLRARLGSVEDIIVRPGPVENESHDVVAAGRALDVDAILTGSVQRLDERIRVTVEIVDVRAGRVLWGKTFDNSSANLFELQDSIVGEVARVLRIRLTSKVSGGFPFGSASIAAMTPGININDFCFNS
jgi:DNA-binding winged helix-turn-helix (wHTH) protein/TolB-like protein